MIFMDYCFYDIWGLVFIYFLHVYIFDFTVNAVYMIYIVNDFKFFKKIIFALKSQVKKGIMAIDGY